jgi:SAM-dependent methyltransferase
MFTVGTVDFDYYRKPGYNDPSRNERTVELPLASYFVSRRDAKNVVEIGAVTPYYFKVAHEVIDPVDDHPACVKRDARQMDYRGRHVLSVSTIEHIGNAEFTDTLKDNSAWDLLQKIVRDSATYLITFPMGYNANLDLSVRTGDIPCHVLRRINAANDWEICRENRFDYCYNHPFNNGNAICLITNLAELQSAPPVFLQAARLNLGCGDDYREGWVNVDVGKCRKDVEHNLETLPLPFADNQFDYILLQHVIEHVARDKFPLFMRELHRISAPHGVIHIEAPYFNSKNAWTDFTHKNFITEESFGYFDETHHLRHLGLIYGLDFSFRTHAIQFAGSPDNQTIIFDLETVK